MERTPNYVRDAAPEGGKIEDEDDAGQSREEEYE